jgi:hypothetical protein
MTREVPARPLLGGQKKLALFWWHVSSGGIWSRFAFLSHLKKRNIFFFENYRKETATARK